MANSFLDAIRKKAEQAGKEADDYVNVANTGYYPGEEPAPRDPNAPSLADQLRNWSNTVLPSESSASADVYNQAMAARNPASSPMAAPNVGPQQPQLMGPPKPDYSEDDETDTATQVNRGKPLLKSLEIQGLGTKTQDKSAGGGQSSQTVNDILAKLQGNDKALTDARSQRDRMQLLSMLGQSGDQILSGVAHSKISNPVYETMAKNASQGIEDIKTDQAMTGEKLKQHEAATKLKNDLSKADANSAISNEYRQAIKEMTGKDVNPNIAAADLDKMSGIYEKMWQTRENAKMRATLMDEKAKQKGDDKINKMSAAMGTDLDPNKPRSGEFGKNQGRINAADRIEGLYNAVGGNPNAINMRELATSVANMLSSGSQTAVTQVNELVPHTFSGNAAKIQEWLTSNPHGAGQQKFAEMYLHIAQREKEIAQTQMLQAQFKKANSTHSKLKDLDEDSWYHNLAVSTDIPVDKIKEMEQDPSFNGQYKAKDTKTHPQDSEAVAWAKKNPNDPRAAAILQANGM